jgi:putative acetyltransferase
VNAVVEIKPERADHPQVVALLAALDRYLGELYEPEANHILSVSELLAPEVGFFVARQGETIVGTGAVRRMLGDADTDGRPYGEVKRIGERLLQTLEASLKEQGIALALLETGSDQREAVRLYERCGYAPRAAFGGYADNGLSLFMSKVLM